MKFILDTHALLWWDDKVEHLSSVARDSIENSDNDVCFSVVSIYEIIVKVQQNKLQLRLPVEQLVAQQQANGLTLLELSAAHVLDVENLPPIHRDPFDRLLVSQARVEDAGLISIDDKLRQYPVDIVW